MVTDKDNTILGLAVEELLLNKFRLLSNSPPYSSMRPLVGVDMSRLELVFIAAMRDNPAQIEDHCSGTTRLSCLRRYPPCWKITTKG